MSMHRAYAIFQLSYFNWMRSRHRLQHCGMSARETRRRNCFSFFSLFIPIQTPRAGVNHQNMSYSSPRVQFTAIVYNWWFIVLIKGPEILSLFTSSELKCYNSQQVELARSLESRLRRVNRVWNMENECEKWTMKSTLYARALASLSQLSQVYA